MLKEFIAHIQKTTQPLIQKHLLLLQLHSTNVVTAWQLLDTPAPHSN